jgi:hypothetical protein
MRIWTWLYGVRWAEGMRLEGRAVEDSIRADTDERTYRTCLLSRLLDRVVGDVGGGGRGIEGERSGRRSVMEDMIERTGK